MPVLFRACLLYLGHPADWDEYVPKFRVIDNAGWSGRVVRVPEETSLDLRPPAGEAELSIKLQKDRSGNEHCHGQQGERLMRMICRSHQI
jgi:hypothetical protein